MINFAAEEGGGSHILLPPVAEIVVGIIAFAVILFILGKFVFPRMEQMYQARVEAMLRPSL